MSTKFLTQEFRVSFPQVFEPKAFEGGTPKYSMDLIFDKNTDISVLQEAVDRELASEWPDVSKRPKKLRLPIKDGNTDKPDSPEYSDSVYVKATSTRKPGVVGADLSEITDPNAFYGGCYARATLVAKAYSTPANKGVSFYLQNIQKLRDGESFGGHSNPENDFDAVVSDPEAENPDNYSSGADFLK